MAKKRLKDRKISSIVLFCLSIVFLILSGNASISETVRQNTSTQGMVVTSQHLATEVGVDILRQGGNAIDAAVAVGYALAVVHPCCGNLGGGGFMTIQRADGEEIFINFRETAPIDATVDMYAGKDNASQEGYLAAGIPGTVRGLEYALNNYGTLGRSTVMESAIELARKGYILEAGDIEILERGKNLLQYEPEISSIFLKNGESYRVGDRLLQSDLAKTLTAIAKDGETAFYEGEIAKKIVAASQANGGIFTLDDFAEYEIDRGKPLACNYRDREILTSPPPGGGLVVCQMLGILEGYPIETRSVKTIHQRLAAMLFAYTDRNRYLGDPNFISIPTEKLLERDYLNNIRDRIGDRAIPPESLEIKNNNKEGQNTTHYSILDRWGNAVAVTYTINSYFGAGVVVPDTGIILNNEMDDFTTELGKSNQFGLIQGEANQIAPKKRPASSMSPTIVKKDGKVTLIVGSPGGSTIPTTVLQVILGSIDEGKDIVTAVNSPRLHYQGLPNIVRIEENALSKSEIAELEQLGYTIQVSPISWGAADSIEVEKDGMMVGASDRRRSAGLALGL
jgi:gamma-glutamyltranspeptidase / glutathione hydrolase